MKVQELLTDPSTWTQAAGARTANGGNVAPWCAVATCWCLMGAVERCYGLNSMDFERVLGRIVQRVDRSVIAWNDDPARTFAEVKALVTELDL